MYGGKIDATGNVSSQLWVFHISNQSWALVTPKAKEQYAVVGGALSGAGALRVSGVVPALQACSLLLGVKENRAARLLGMHHAVPPPLVLGGSREREQVPPPCPSTAPSRDRLHQHPYPLYIHYFPPNSHPSSPLRTELDCRRHLLTTHRAETLVYTPNTPHSRDSPTDSDLGLERYGEVSQMTL